MAEQHYYSQKRYVVKGPSLEKSQSFFVEKTARRLAEALNGQGHNVHVEEQELRGREWVAVGQAA